MCLANRCKTIKAGDRMNDMYLEHCKMQQNVVNELETALKRFEQHNMTHIEIYNQDEDRCLNNIVYLTRRALPKEVYESLLDNVKHAIQVEYKRALKTYNEM